MDKRVFDLQMGLVTDSAKRWDDGPFHLGSGVGRVLEMASAKKSGWVDCVG